MNTTNATVISRILNSAGICKSQTGRSRVSTISSEGFEVYKDYKGQVKVKYDCRTSAGNAEYERFLPRLEQTMKEIAEILLAKGYALETEGRNCFIVTKAGN
jgi:predicted transcriptional regulator